MREKQGEQMGPTNTSKTAIEFMHNNNNGNESATDPFRRQRADPGRTYVHGRFSAASPPDGANPRGTVSPPGVCCRNAPSQPSVLPRFWRKASTYF